MLDGRTYRRMLDDFEDTEYIGKRLLESMSEGEMRGFFGIDKPLPPGVMLPPGHLPIHWRKNPGFDQAGNLCCAGCGKPMTMVQSQKDGHTHAACATQGCELYARDYVEGSEVRSPHRHTPNMFDPVAGKYVCGCGEKL